MLELIYENSFKRDYKKIRSNPLNREVEYLLRNFYSQLLTGNSLPERWRDHQLQGKWKDFRECHLKPDLLLIYQFVPDKYLRLVRIGSHSDLF